MKSEAEALAWKEEQCKASKKSGNYKENQKRCMKKKDTERCTMVGKCFVNSHENRPICKYCYKFVNLIKDQNTGGPQLMRFQLERSPV